MHRDQWLVAITTMLTLVTGIAAGAGFALYLTRACP
jgi:hypothetical protein